MSETRYSRCPKCGQVLSGKCEDSEALCPWCMDKNARPEPVAVVPLAEWEAAQRLHEALESELDLQFQSPQTYRAALRARGGVK